MKTPDSVGTSMPVAAKPIPTAPKPVTIKLILSHIGNFTKGRSGHKITRGYFHRTAVKGDTALGEANYFHNHCVVASFYAVIDLLGNVVKSVLAQDTEYAVAQQFENQISLNIEFTGLQGTPLTAQQIASAIAFIKSDPAFKTIANHRLSIGEIPLHKTSGWGNHKDVTVAYRIFGGHTDAISEAEIAQILKGIK